MKALCCFREPESQARPQEWWEFLDCKIVLFWFALHIYPHFETVSICSSSWPGAHVGPRLESSRAGLDSSVQRAPPGVVPEYCVLEERIEQAWGHSNGQRRLLTEEGATEGRCWVRLRSSVCCQCLPQEPACFTAAPGPHSVLWDLCFLQSCSLSLLLCAFCALCLDCLCVRLFFLTFYMSLSVIL